MLSACPCPAFRRLAALAAAAVFGLSTGGCSYSLGGFSGKDDKAEMTASVSQPARGKASPPAEADLAIAKAAVNDALSRGGQDTSVPWENPRTGARGTITPIATAYSQDGFTCREFRASYVREGDESWLQGEACRIHHGKWEVKNLRPLVKRT